MRDGLDLDKTAAINLHQDRPALTRCPRVETAPAIPPEWLTFEQPQARRRMVYFTVIRVYEGRPPNCDGCHSKTYCRCHDRCDPRLFQFTRGATSWSQQDLLPVS